MRKLKISAYYKTLFLIIAFGLAGCARDKYPKNEWDTALCSSEWDAPPNNLNGEKADELIRDALKSDRGVGFTAAVMIDGQLIWSGAAGKAIRTKNGEITRNAKMRIGSLAKPLTAALAAKMYEEGAIDIDAPIQTYVPAFPVKQETITIRQLAMHISGIRQYDFSNLSESSSGVHYDRLEDALHVFADDPLIFNPGDALHYSSLGYNLIGAALENASDTSFDQAIRRKITEPMDLNETLVDDPSQFTQCRTKFYTILFAKVPIVTLWRDQSDSYSSAGMLSSAEDMAAFATAVFASDFFAPAGKTLLTTPGALNDGTIINRTFGWEVSYNEQGEIDWYGHGGVTNGAHASVRYYPALKMAVAGIVNYNYLLSDRYPDFFEVTREELPALFSHGAAREKVRGLESSALPSSDQ